VGHNKEEEAREETRTLESAVEELQNGTKRLGDTATSVPGVFDIIRNIG
jgi:hypothetical protein